MDEDEIKNWFGIDKIRKDKGRKWGGECKGGVEDGVLCQFMTYAM